MNGNQEIHPTLTRFGDMMSRCTEAWGWRGRVFCTTTWASFTEHRDSYLTRGSARAWREHTRRSMTACKQL